jgi:glutamine amidotransferase
MLEARVAVINYGGGNIGSLLAALERHGVAYVVTESAADVESARGTIFPGDGAFAATMHALAERGLDRAILASIERGAPFLGVCVGMQVLFEGSTEFGTTAGLGVLEGTVARFERAERIPHMGWNTLEAVRTHPFVDGITAGDFAYFLHSYRAPVGDATVMATTYGDRFTSVVARGNVMGTQFHPEKSQRTGDLLLANYVKLLHEESTR